MNAAVLMFTACLATPGQAPVAMPAGPGPVVVYPGQGYGYPPQGYGGGYGGGSAGGCCGHSSVGCCEASDCCLLHKIKEKICCIHIHITCEKTCCEKGPVCPKPCPPKPVCQKPCPPPCPPKPVCKPCPPKPVCCPKPAPVCNPCPPKPVCNPCPPKPTCCKVEPVCHTPCSNVCWTPGYCLHKCKEKLCGICDHGGGCHGGCGTAATPNACGSSVIAPAPGMMGPGTYVPAPVNPGPKAMPNVSKTFESPYGIVRPELTPVVGTAPRVIDLTPSPF